MLSKEQIEAMLAEYRKQLDAFVLGANLRVAELNGAIKALEALLAGKQEQEPHE